MDKLIDLLYRCFAYDVEVLSQPWLYWCLLIPACCYMMFFFMKWTVLTAPLWLPFAIVTALWAKKVSRTYVTKVYQRPMEVPSPDVKPSPPTGVAADPT